MSPWSVRSRRRRRLARASVLSAMALALVGVISSAQATPTTPAPPGSRTASHLRGPARQRHDALGDYQALAQSLPLVDLAPGPRRRSTSAAAPGPADRPAPRLDASYNTFNELEIGPRGARRELQDGVAFTVGTSAVCRRSSGGIIARRPDQRQPPRRAAARLQGRCRVDGGGSLDIDFVLATTLTFRLDTSGGSALPGDRVLARRHAEDRPLRRVDAASPPSRLASASPTSRSRRTTPVRRADTAKLKACAKIPFRIPDSNGVLTQDEFSSARPDRTSRTPRSSTDSRRHAATISTPTFFLDASLVPGTPDATIAFTDATSPSRRRPPSPPTLGLLDRLLQHHAGRRDQRPDAVRRCVRRLADAGNGAAPVRQGRAERARSTP